jgi:hypothetical protein
MQFSSFSIVFCGALGKERTVLAILFSFPRAPFFYIFLSKNCKRKSREETAKR